MDGAKVGYYDDTQDDPVPAKDFKVILLDVIQQESDGQIGDGKRNQYACQQDNWLQCRKSVAVKQILGNFEQGSAKHRGDGKKKREFRCHVSRRTY